MTPETVTLFGSLALVSAAGWIYYRSTPASLQRRIEQTEAVASECIKLCKGFKEEYLARETAQVRFEEEIQNLLHEARNNSRRAAQHAARAGKVLTPPGAEGETAPLTEAQQREALARRLDQV